ncbi:HAD family phosphatase [Mesorhizobium sp. VK22B]|uniref:HAD family phosphatase n=1 Tax=Mesorhizobium captivum TaxID=3072319 RepID=A0ABU4Z4V4_9HYPH|nr:MULTISPECIES: HAD family phosphatase [unclassified Mesorhizobium]MDX8493104.1 HAD family phosphatase [Mesorhizobium sp. VK22B]MDX8507650.1 HAD family phosphatase [Mesorhizobium sp. VK22E]
MSKSAIRAVIFDVDGCLVDSEPLSLEAVAAEIRASGLSEMTADRVREKYLGISISTICREIGESLGQACPEGFAERVEDRLFEAYQTGLRQIDGVPGLLEALDRAGIAVAIATSSSVRRLEKTLEMSGLAARFGGRGFSSDQVERGKPAPDLFLLAAEKLGVHPTQCAVLEDSPHGIKGAVAAGMRPVGFVGGSHLKGREEVQTAVLRCAGAIEVIDHLSKAHRALAPYRTAS